MKTIINWDYGNAKELKDRLEHTWFNYKMAPCRDNLYDFLSNIIETYVICKEKGFIIPDGISVERMNIDGMMRSVIIVEGMAYTYGSHKNGRFSFHGLEV